MSASVNVKAIRRQVVDYLDRECLGGLLTYDAYLLWRGGEFEECDVQASIRGYVRPAHHCPERYRLRPTDPDNRARIRITAEIERLCQPIWDAYDNVLVIVRLRGNRPSFRCRHGWLWRALSWLGLSRVWWELPITFTVDIVGQGALV